MGLRERAAAITKKYVENKDKFFGWDITVTNPAGVSKPFVGLSSDISQIVDPDTGQVVSGRMAHVSIPISSIVAALGSIPEGIADASSKPWLVAFDDINGNPYKFKVFESNPDRAIDLVVCILELYE